VSQEEDEYWEGKITEARRGQLETVRKAAASWSTLFTAVLGVFTTVTFASGLTGLNDLSTETRNLVRGGIAVAVIATLTATVLAGAAANSLPRKYDDLTVDTYKARYKKQATTALTRLRLSMLFGVLAAIVVVAGSFVVLFAEKAPVKPQPIIASVSGKTYCGTPVVQPDGSLSIGDIPLNGATSLTVVTKCP
jgi:hypothetical protein